MVEEKSGGVVVEEQSSQGRINEWLRSSRGPIEDQSGQGLIKELSRIDRGVSIK